MMNNLAEKQKLSPVQLSIVHEEFDRKKRSRKITWILLCLFGWLGAHRFYLGDNGQGLIRLFTLNGFMLLYFWDGATIDSRIDKVNERIEREIIEKVAGVTA